MKKEGKKDINGQEWRVIMGGTIIVIMLDVAAVWMLWIFIRKVLIAPHRLAQVGFLWRHYGHLAAVLAAIMVIVGVWSVWWRKRRR